MTNTEIITNALKARGMTDDQLSQLLDAYKGDLPFHTIPEWSRRGYHVKAGETPLFTCDLWKHTSKPSRAAIEAAQEAGEEVPEQSPHFYRKLSYIYSFAQVEKNATAPDLLTIKARFGSLPGLVLTVKGEKTGAPNVWLSGDVEKYADEIKAAGGIWSQKKSAYWIKPGTAPAEEKPAAPASAPARKTAPKMETWTVHPGRRTPQPWKKCSFYTYRKAGEDGAPVADLVDGYTDGIFNYYASGRKSKQWHAIHPVYGLSVAYESTRQAAQARALELTDNLRKLEANPTPAMQAAADAIRTAQDGGNLSLF